MSHINKITRATKAYHILAEATNVHLELTEMIHRLILTDTFRPIFAARKALTGETMPMISSHLMATRLLKDFWRALGIDGNFEGKAAALNVFGAERQEADQQGGINNGH